MGKRVLAVDDDELIRGLVKAILEDQGYEVVLAENGEAAMAWLDSQPRPLQLVLCVLDVVMPGMNGLEVLTRLKQQAHTRDLPVLMLSGEDKAEDIMAGYNIGADYYITKPFTRQQLLYGVELLLADKTR